jgi:FkbM family methyltransferase
MIQRQFVSNIRVQQLPSNKTFSHLESFDVSYKGGVMSVQKFHKKNPHMDRPDLYAKLFNGFFNVIHRFVRPGSVAIDIGAYAGEMAIPMAIAAEGGKVYAFEPSDSFSKYLTISLGLNPTLNIEAYPYAIMEKDGIHKFLYCPTDDNGGCAASNAWVGTYTVPTYVRGIKFEPFFAPRIKFEDVSFIKIDTEGHDFHILQDFQDILKASRPVIYAEWFPKTENQISELASFLGYQILCGFTLERITMASTWRQDIVLVPTELLSTYDLS